MEEQKNGELVQVQEPKKVGWRRFVYLEPAIFFFNTGVIMDYALIQQYVYYRSAHKHGLPVDYMMDDSGGCGVVTNANNSFAGIEGKVQAEASMINLGISISIQVPSIIVSLLFGAWTDKNGRRPALFSPVIGSIAHCVIQLFVMYLNLPLYVLFFASFVNGCSGYIPTMTQTSSAYVSDITSESSRIFRVAILEFLILIAGVLGYMLTGWGIEFLGFISPVWVILGCQIACCLYLLILPESRPNVPDAPRFLSLHSFKSMWSVYSKPRSDGGRKVLNLFITCNSLLWMSILGVDGILTLFYLASPLCFSSVMIGYLFSYMFFAIAVGTVAFSAKPFLRRVGEFKMAVAGIISVWLALGWLAFCDRRWMVYLEPIIALPSGAIDPIMKGWMSKIVSEEEQGAMFAAVTTIEAIAVVIGTSMFNSIYSALVEIGFGSMTFLVPAGIAVVPMFIICCVRKEVAAVEQKQSKKIKVEISTEKEGDKLKVSTEKEGDKLKVSTEKIDSREQEKEAGNAESINSGVRIVLGNESNTQ